MTLRWLAITCDAQRLLTKSQMWGKLWHATVQAGGWVGVRSGREKHLPGKTPQTAPPSQDLNVVNAATKVDPRAMAEPGSRYPEGDGPPQDHIFHMLPPPVFDHPTNGVPGRRVGPRNGLVLLLIKKFLRLRRGRSGRGAASEISLKCPT